MFYSQRWQDYNISWLFDLIIICDVYKIIWDKIVYKQSLIVDCKKA